MHNQQLPAPVQISSRVPSSPNQRPPTSLNGYRQRRNGGLSPRWVTGEVMPCRRCSCLTKKGHQQGPRAVDRDVLGPRSCGPAHLHRGHRRQLHSPRLPNPRGEHPYPAAGLRPRRTRWHAPRGTTLACEGEPHHPFATTPPPHSGMVGQQFQAAPRLKPDSRGSPTQSLASSKLTGHRYTVFIARVLASPAYTHSHPPSHLPPPKKSLYPRQ